MIKYAKGAFNPHEKKVFITEDERELCWSDKDSKDKKLVPISEIIRVEKG